MSQTPLILSGKPVAETLMQSLQARAAQVSARLVVVLVGDDPASELYVKMKVNACEEVGIASEVRLLPDTASQDDVLDVVHELNTDDSVTGFFVQLPLPPQIDRSVILSAISADKDVDGLTPLSIGRLALGYSDDVLVPATPRGVMHLLEYYKIELMSKRVCIIGTSNTVGKPLGMLMIESGATVSYCNVHTPDITPYASIADIVVVATGVRHLLKPHHISDSIVLIDVGIHQLDGRRVTGDIDPACYPISSAYTPVPGGVGPTTVATLMENTIIAAERLSGLGANR